MVEEKNKGKLIFYGILLIILFFGLIGVFISAGGKFFWLELIGMLFLLLLTLVSLAGYQKSWGERVLFFVFVFYIINLILVWFFIGPLYLVLLFIALLGFVMSVPRKCCSGCKTGVPAESVKEEEEPHSEVFDVISEPEKEVLAEKKVKHSPGKYIASKRGKYFHEPKSEWAKKINKNNQVWFENKQQAYRKGYKAHSDVA
jgi:hypothetical protein